MENNKCLKDVESAYRKIISLNDNVDEPCSLLDNNHLIIPIYQRPYSWKKENIMQLLKDINHQIVHFVNEDYFMGTIFCIKNDLTTGYENKKNKFELIDGQQRLTTFVLILSYLKLCFINNDNFSQYIKQINQIELESKCDVDNEILQVIIKCSSINSLFEELNNKKKELKNENEFSYHQYANFFNILKNIDLYFKKNNEKEKFLDYIFTHIKIVQISAKPNSLIGDEFFISLNGKGLKLSQVDLLKCTFIHPYSKEKNSIEKFKNMWGKLISNTNNDLETKINNYFEAYTNEVIPYSNLNNFISNKFQGDILKDEFEKMCDFFEKYKNLLKNFPAKIIFWIKLFKKMSHSMYEKILFLILIKIKKSGDNVKNYYLIINEILSTLFKITIIFLKILNQRTSIFTEKIIHKYIRNMYSIENLKNDLELTLIKILKGKDETIHTSFEDFKFDPNTYCEYRINEDKDKNKFTFLLFLIDKFYSNDTNDLNYAETIKFESYDLDHIVAKSAIYKNKDGKNIKAWTQVKNENKITFDNEFYSKVITNDKKFVKKYSIKKEMTYLELLKILNKPFNLQLLVPEDNKRKGTINHKSIDELAKIFTIKNEQATIEKLKKAWNWLFNL